MGIITFNGVSSESIGLVVENPPDYEMPERIYEVTSVPGRNGDVVKDTKSYKNVVRNYDVAIGAEGANFASLAIKISNWLNSEPGYLRLEDSYLPDHFMLARCAESVTITNILQQAGRATIPFDRKPQRFLKSGERSQTFSSSPATLQNPTNQIAKPLIKVNGSGAGTITINDVEISITKNNGYIMLDCDIEEAYTNVNWNLYVKTPKGFPNLKPGENTIKFTGSITSLEITPRWWII